MKKNRKQVLAGVLSAMLLAGSIGANTIAAPVQSGNTGSTMAGLAFFTSAVKGGAVVEKIEKSESTSTAAAATAEKSAASIAAAANVPAVATVPEETSPAAAAETTAAENAAPETEPETTEPETSPYEDVAVSQVGADDGYVNIRDQASTEGEILGKIYNNCAATIEEAVEMEDGTWYKIHSGSVEGYIKAEYFVTGDEAEALAIEIGKIFGYVEEGGLRVRTEPNTDSDVITKLYSGEIYTVIESETNGFVKLDLGDDEDGNKITGYVSAEYVDIYVKFDKAISLEEEAEQKAEEERRAKEAAEAEEAARKAAAAEAAASERQAVVAYAKQFIGNPYVWGGSSLTNGADCSGFTMSVYRHFGVSLSHSSRAQANEGRRVSLDSVQPGDLIFYANGGSIYHVAIYCGGGKVVHAISEGRGIGVSSMYCMTPYCAVSLF